MSSVDGTTWDPYSEEVLFTQETSFNAGYDATDTSKTSGGVAATKLEWSGTSDPRA